MQRESKSIQLISHNDTSRFLSRERKNVKSSRKVKVVHTGKRGRPRKVPDIQFLREAMAPGRHIKITELARILKIDRNTLYHYLDAYDIKTSFSPISDDDLDGIVKDYRKVNPHAGVRYLRGHLRELGYKVQQVRIQQSVERVDPLGQVLHESNPVRRRKYRVARPNALWHIDGHHKLIRWGFVIHGIIDGFSRKVCVTCITGAPKLRQP